MDKKYFRFEVPEAPEGPLVEMTFQEAEKMLLKKLHDAGDDPKDALWQLAQFYKLNKQHEKALQYLRQLMPCLPGPEEKANCIFTMGQAMEQVGDSVAAAKYYREALSLEPASTFTWYFIHNNLGFCLNQMEQFADGEDLCRKAIQIDPNRPNGHKNLGIALAGQGRYREAAQAYVASTQVNAADARSFHLLESLIKEHPELEFEFKDELDYCRKAVEVVAKKVNEMKPVIHRGWRKQWILFKAKVQSLFRNSRHKKP